MDIIISTCSTVWGWIGIAASQRGVAGLTLPQASAVQALSVLRRQWPKAHEGNMPLVAVLREKLQRYFRGEAVDFGDEVLDIDWATAFRVRVWKVVRAIPRGQVRSYGWVAKQAGSPHGARAVGRAMAANPVPIIIPCHRVVGWNGQLTGFGGGLDMKRRLLELEQAGGDPRIPPSLLPNA